MKRILFSFLCFLQGQNTYQGQVTFDYEGTESGVFSSTLQDSIILDLVLIKLMETVLAF